MTSKKMPPSPNDDKRPGFLLDQSFWLAESKSQDVAWSMAVHEVEPSDDRTKLESGIRPPLDAEHDRREAAGRWLRIDRDELVRRAVEDPLWSRVGLVCGAGLGKTTSLQWLESAVNRHDDCPFLAFYRELECLPADVEELVAKFAEQIHLRTSIGKDRAAARIRELREEGKIILLLDSLDQGNPDPSGATVRGLKNLFAGHWGKCRIWVSGRPYAFRLSGEAIREDYPNTDWQFARVGQLDEPECRQLLQTTGLVNLPHKKYPKPHLLDSLPAAGKRLVRLQALIFG